jgi:chromosome partitioning protein
MIYNKNNNAEFIFTTFYTGGIVLSIIITVSNQKGGVGKTTTSAALMSGIAMEGKRVLGIDLDPQGNLGFCLGTGMANPHTVLDVMKGSIPVHKALVRCDYGDLLVSDITLSSSGLDKVTANREYILRDAIKPVIDFYDYIIIDTPPALNLLTVNAYSVSDYLIIPMASDILSLVGLAQLKETIESVRESFNPGLNVLGILLTRFNPRTLLSRDVLDMAEQLARQINSKVFISKIRSGVAIAEAPAHGESIFSYNPRSAAVKDYQAFIQEIASDIHLKEGI